MLSKEQHDIVKAAAEILKGELKDLAPGTPEDKAAKVLVYKFGSFTIRKAKARKVQNVRAGGEIEVPERLVVKFSASKTWLDILNGGTEE